MRYRATLRIVGMRADSDSDGSTDQRSLERRDLIKRALVGGAVIWAAPAVETFAHPTSAWGWGGGTGSKKPCTWFVIRIDIKNSSSCVCLDSFSNVFNQLLCLSNNANATLKLCSPGGCGYYKGFYKNGDDWYVKLDPKVEKSIAWTKAGTLCCACTETVSFPTYRRIKFSPCPKPGKLPVKCEQLCIAFCIVK